MRLLTLFLTLILFSAPAFAGGSGQDVHVQKLTLLSDTDYILVVRPEPGKNGYEDPYMGDCKQFEVHGTLQRLRGKYWLEWFIWWKARGTPTKEQHLAALAYLKKFEGSAKTILFGWIGSGFEVIDPRNPCIVESRGLRLLEDPDGVFSFFNAI
ncbi:MAG: hypothetical protein EPN97_16105 [Alphaproteobacteria bacterium]|nr:MAG: hypothetical protein EPN97_16105 [Alphaproteobacteria bacterium]